VKYIKMLGLSMVAAIAAMAFVGASSASASGFTALCFANELPCASANLVPSDTTIVGKATNPVLLTNISNVTCETSEVTLLTLEALSAESGKRLDGDITGLSFNKCKNSLGQECVVTPNATPYLALLLHTAGTMSGTLSVEKSTGGAPGATVSCPGLKCEFTLPTTSELTVDGATETAAAQVLASNTVLNFATKGGFLECPKEAKWDANYVQTSPAKKIYVSE
jgi:hypothetical protein